ncbi:MAG: bifunctional riboflavin kinase/FAD synthetase [Leptolinea sp.]
MIRASSIAELSLDKACVTIGSFDGVHAGHKRLIEKLKDSAEGIKAPAVVITFFPHPAVVIKNLKTPYYLSTQDEKTAQLEALGVDVLITIPFTVELAALSASEFMQLLFRHLGLRKLIVGPGFALGKGRFGTIEVLSGIGKDMGFDVLVMGPENFGDTIISSSKIRQLIEAGDVQTAAQFLGNYYSIQGFVVKGDARGHKIGFPTANLDIWQQKLLPAPGVYRCFTMLDGKPLLSVINIGYRPTFSNNSNRVFIEVHILDFDGDLYGKELQVQFTHRLRGEIKFPSFEELIHQIQSDIQAAREL